MVCEAPMVKSKNFTMVLKNLGDLLLVLIPTGARAPMRESE